eukprot:TRINITY_DN15225_c0_g1_i10.p1 TRINITY_DN15225_c0_g1~~TRINITY_DN15225_c0_g1_i10.p1  ORF type:complete len:992 (-),score=167.41 TRINITY_DN15225_c0_g1_i10:365-3340(-)
MLHSAKPLGPVGEAFRQVSAPEPAKEDSSKAAETGDAAPESVTSNNTRNSNSNNKNSNSNNSNSNKNTEQQDQEQNQAYRPISAPLGPRPGIAVSLPRRPCSSARNRVATGNPFTRLSEKFDPELEELRQFAVRIEHVLDQVLWPTDESLMKEDGSRTDLPLRGCWDAVVALLQAMLRNIQRNPAQGQTWKRQLAELLSRSLSFVRKLEVLRQRGYTLLDTAQEIFEMFEGVPADIFLQRVKAAKKGVKAEAEEILWEAKALEKAHGVVIRNLESHLRALGVGASPLCPEGHALVKVPLAALQTAGSEVKCFGCEQIPEVTALSAAVTGLKGVEAHSSFWWKCRSCYSQAKQSSHLCAACGTESMSCSAGARLREMLPTHRWEDVLSNLTFLVESFSPFPPAWRRKSVENRTCSIRASHPNSELVGSVTGKSLRAPSPSWKRNVSESNTGSKKSILDAEPSADMSEPQDSLLCHSSETEFVSSTVLRALTKTGAEVIPPSVSTQLPRTICADTDEHFGDHFASLAETDPEEWRELLKSMVFEDPGPVLPRNALDPAAAQKLHETHFGHAPGAINNRYRPCRKIKTAPKMENVLQQRELDQQESLPLKWQLQLAPPESPQPQNLCGTLKLTTDMRKSRQDAQAQLRFHQAQDAKLRARQMMVSTTGAQSARSTPTKENELRPRPPCRNARSDSDPGTHKCTPRSSRAFGVAPEKYFHGLGSLDLPVWRSTAHAWKKRAKDSVESVGQSPQVPQVHYPQPVHNQVEAPVESALNWDDVGEWDNIAEDAEVRMVNQSPSGSVEWLRYYENVGQPCVTPEFRFQGQQGKQSPNSSKECQQLCLSGGSTPDRCASSRNRCTPCTPEPQPSLLAGLEANCPRQDFEDGCKDSASAAVRNDRPISGVSSVAAKTIPKDLVAKTAVSSGARNMPKLRPKMPEINHICPGSLPQKHRTRLKGVGGWLRSMKARQKEFVQDVDDKFLQGLVSYGADPVEMA